MSYEEFFALHDSNVRKRSTRVKPAPILTVEQALEQGVSSASLEAIAQWHDSFPYDFDLHKEMARTLRSTARQLKKKE